MLFHDAVGVYALLFSYNKIAMLFSLLNGYYYICYLQFINIIGSAQKNAERWWRIDLELGRERRTLWN